MSQAVASRRAFYGVSGLLFAVSSALTIAWCESMSSMGEMPMPGGWTMSMAWMRMPGQSWAGVAATFVGMWTVMMVAMMLPSLVPVLSRHHQALGRTGASRPGRLTALAGLSYFSVWALFGMAVFPLGAALAAVAMQEPALAHAAPIAAGVVVLIAGALQFTRRKAHLLACWRTAPGHGRTLPADAGTAWRHGLRLGIHCIHCSFGPTAILLVMGVMDLRAMAVVAAAITVERLAPSGARVARVTGAVAVGAGLVLIAPADDPSALGLAMPSRSAKLGTVQSEGKETRARSSSSSRCADASLDRRAGAPHDVLPSSVTIDVPGATATRVFGINARGDLVGTYLQGGTSFAFLARRTR